MLQKISDNSHLMRDSTSNAIINVDSKSYRDYINTRNRMESQNSTIVALGSQISILTQEMENIKNLLSGIIK